MTVKNLEELYQLCLPDVPEAVIFSVVQKVKDSDEPEDSLLLKTSNRKIDEVIESDASLRKSIFEYFAKEPITSPDWNFFLTRKSLLITFLETEVQNDNEEDLVGRFENCEISESKESVRDTIFQFFMDESIESFNCTFLHNNLDLLADLVIAKIESTDSYSFFLKLSESFFEFKLDIDEATNYVYTTDHWSLTVPLKIAKAAFLKQMNVYLEFEGELNANRAKLESRVEDFVAELEPWIPERDEMGRTPRGGCYHRTATNYDFGSVTTSFLFS